ncbi:MAG: TIR domain-containing protein [Bacteroidales bacterium]|nr:TIR domain-containing protein [Bacteroidales bacterium]
MNHDVFISYSSKNPEVALAVCHTLEEHGIKCWMAPRNIPPGGDYGDLIDEAIIASKVFLFIYSFESVNSVWCKGELNVAFSEEKTIIPYRIDTTPMKGAVRVMLNQRHWLDAYPDYKSQFASLVEAVNRSLGKTMVPNSMPLRSTPTEEKTYKVGDLYDENGKKGVVFEISADGKHGKIVSLIEGAEMEWRSYDGYANIQWGLDFNSGEGCGDRQNGYVNMQKIQEIPQWQKKFPAFAWCANLGDGWYLPATDELKAICNTKYKINSTLSANGCNTLRICHWSSVEMGGNFACYISMPDGRDNYDSKNRTFSVRAVSAF